MDFTRFMISTREDLEQNEKTCRKIRKYLKDWQNPIEYLKDLEFRERYRMTKQGVIDFLVVFESELSQPRKGQGLPVLHKLLVFLRFCSSGSFQLISGDLEKIAQPTVSNIVKEVAYVIASKVGQFVKWPGTPGKISQCKQEFFSIAGFPGIIGAIDCTHIKIQSPGGEQAERFRNRKGYFSINCQAVCDARLLFTNIYAVWYGSVHDARIFDNSELRYQLEQEPLHQNKGYLLGDQGYPLTTYLLTPVRFTSNRAEANYNKAHKKTRLTIERAFGVLKRIFSCLRTGLRLKVQTTLDVIPACIVMYNFMRRRNMIDNSFDGHLTENTTVANEVDVPTTSYSRASAARREFISMHFEHENYHSNYVGAE